MWVAWTGLPFIFLYSKISGTKPTYTRESLIILSEGNRMISNARAKNELNFNPRPLTESIRDLLTWFRDNKLIQ